MTRSDITVLAAPLRQLGFSRPQIDAIVAATGAQNGRAYGFTFSDLTQRLLPAIVLDAYPAKAVSPHARSKLRKRWSRRRPFRMAHYERLVAVPTSGRTARRYSAAAGNVRKSFDHPARKATPASKFGWSSWIRTCPAVIRQQRRMSSTAMACSANRSTSWYSTGSTHLSFSTIEGQTIIPAESVYAVFEAKQSDQCGSGRATRRRRLRASGGCIGRACRSRMREESTRQSH